MLLVLSTIVKGIVISLEFNKTNSNKMISCLHFNLLRRQLTSVRSFAKEMPKLSGFSTISSLQYCFVFICHRRYVHYSIIGFCNKISARNDIAIVQQQKNLPRNQQIRSYTSKKHRKKSKDEIDPFHVLGISKPVKKKLLVDDTAPEGISYSIVKRTFLQIAMKHHPDTSTASTPEDISKHREIFLAARKAFEAIVEGTDGYAIVRSESDKHKNTEVDEHDFENWFQGETGHSMPYMDMKTMKEVAEMTESMGGGLDRGTYIYLFFIMIRVTIFLF